jgi:hypothetical protein
MLSLYLALWLPCQHINNKELDWIIIFQFYEVLVLKLPRAISEVFTAPFMKLQAKQPKKPAWPSV